MESNPKRLAPATYHNAGHAVATALIEASVSSTKCEDPSHDERWNAEYEAMTALGGVVAERLFLGVVEPAGAKNDIENAFRHISVLTSIPGEQAAYVTLMNTRVETLLGAHREFIQHVAETIERTDRPANEIARSDVNTFVRRSVALMQ